MAAALTTAGCTGAVWPLRPFNETQIGCDQRQAGDELELTYLGAGGYLMKWRDHAIMTAPFYSNPGFLRTGVALPIWPDAKAIAANLSPVHGVEAILVGHAHYDHLMDAVWVVENRIPDAVVYGSRTMKNILAARPNIRTKSLEQGAGDAFNEGQWVDVAGPAIRVMALRSEHAPHWWRIKLFEGEVSEPRTTLPSTAYGWKEGQTLAYVIDFMDARGRTAIRLHYQDSASTPPLGFPPPSVEDVDVSLLCAASYSNVEGYPEGLLAMLRPRAVLLTHWEDFFQDVDDPVRVVRFTDGKVLAQRLNDTGVDWSTPYPKGKATICPRPSKR